MNTTNTILIEEEPAVFDPTIVSLNGKWVDWYMTKHDAGATDAIIAGLSKLDDMVDHLTYLSSVECVGERHRNSSNQLIALAENMQQCQRLFAFISDIRARGWIARIKDSDPSVFATSGSNVGIRSWLSTVIRDENLARVHTSQVAEMIIGSTLKITRQQYKAAFGKGEPPLTSSLPGVPSLRWVLFHALHNGIKMEKAHDVGLIRMASGDATSFKA
jgi:hypothetical protein